MKHNNQLPNAHFRKNWQVRVKTWLDQAGRKRRRRTARLEKAKLAGVRPTDALRPAVRCPTIKHNTKLRAGRGFTLEEIKAAGVTKAYARSVGIAVDHRRRNKSEESLALNKTRLQAYIARLVVLPKQTPAELATATGVSVAKAFPIVNDKAPEAARPISKEEREFAAHKALRKAWGTQKYAGERAKRAAEKAEAEANKK